MFHLLFFYSLPSSLPPKLLYVFCKVSQTHTGATSRIKETEVRGENCTWLLKWPVSWSLLSLLGETCQLVPAPAPAPFLYSHVPLLSDNAIPPAACSSYETSQPQREATSAMQDCSPVGYLAARMAGTCPGLPTVGQAV